MADHTYSKHLGDNGQVASAVVDRDDGIHLLADAPEVVAWLAAGNALLEPARLRLATTYQLMKVLTDAQRTTYVNAKPWDQRLFSARDTPWPESNEKIGRIAVVIGTTPAAWFDAALAPVAA